MSIPVQKIKLRPYQQEAYDSIKAEWRNGAQNVCAVLPTGAGKTVLFSELIKDHSGPSCAIAHRQELVSQISMALARDGVRHRIVGSTSVVKIINQLHMQELGRSWYDPSAPCAVASVATLLNRAESLQHWCKSVTLWVHDECHHVLKDNQFGKAIALFPNAKGLGVTATPLRADGAGLGRDFDGVMDSLIVGPPMRALIDAKYLTDYRVFLPPSDVDLVGVETSKATGDYNRTQLSTAVGKSHIVGDVVSHYKRIAMGKLGVTFAVDVANATEIAAQFNASGVPAAVVSAKTPDLERAAVLRRFRNRELLQLVNVDLFGEGFDLPAIEVVSMARPTQSYGLYCQIFGRALRLLEGKMWAIVIDHVGNVTRHGLPDKVRQWTLARRDKKSSGPADAIMVRNCLDCFAVYPRESKVCPYCGVAWKPQERSAPHFVDGDLTELSPEALARLRATVSEVDKNALEYRESLFAKHVPSIGINRMCRLHEEHQAAQEELRLAIATWAGGQRALGRPDDESYRRFYLAYGIDVLSAMALSKDEATKLKERIV